MKNKSWCLIPFVLSGSLLIMLAAFPSCQCLKKESHITRSADNQNSLYISTASSHSSQGKDSEIPYVVVEEMPIFPGGDSALLGFIAKNTKYPESAKTRKAQGRVILRFCVNADGTVSQSSILKGADPELDAEAIRVTESLPKFTPGRQGGKPVPVWYMVPVEFKLN